MVCRTGENINMINEIFFWVERMKRDVLLLTSDLASPSHGCISVAEWERARGW